MKINYIYFNQIREQEEARSEARCNAVGRAVDPDAAIEAPMTPESRPLTPNTLDAIIEAPMSPATEETSKKSGSRTSTATGRSTL